MVALALGIACGAWLGGAAPEIPEPTPSAAPVDAAPSSAPPTSASPTDASPTDAEPLDRIDIESALAVNAGATCIDHIRLATQVRTWLEDPRIDARLRIEVVGDEESPLRLSFTLRRDDEIIAVREFDPAPERCTDLHAVVGLAIALAIDATVLESVGVEPREPPVKPPTDPVRKPPRVPPTVPKAKPRTWRMRTDVTGLFTYGHPPGVGGGVKLELGFGWREILELGGGAMASWSGSQPVGDGEASFSVVGGLAQICGGPPWKVVRPRGCVGVIAGAAFAAAQGFKVDQTYRTTWVVIPFGADLRVRISRRLSFTLGVDGLAAVVVPVFEAETVAEDRVVRRFQRVGLAIEAGLSILVW
jgi:hypothetical protein